MSSTTDRVRALIQASGLSQGAFAQQVGLDDSKLSKSLSGARRFTSLDLARIADVTDVTVDWLITGQEAELVMAARSAGGSASTAATEAKRLSTLRADVASLGFPQPWHPVPRATGSSWVHQGQQLARAALERARDVDGSDLPALIEKAFGADVAVADLGSNFDGLAVSSEDVKLILVAETQLPARQRFTMAHELGHLLAGDDQQLHLDANVYDPALRREPSEMRANAFAASFLMPEGRLREAASGGLPVEGFAALACDLQVSPSALAYRLTDIRLIDSGMCDRYKALSAAKAAHLAGRGDEFAHSVTAASMRRPPGLLVRDTYQAYEAGQATLRPYANVIGRDVDSLRRDLEGESQGVDAS